MNEIFISKDLYLLIPEIIMSLGAMFVLLFSSYTKKNSASLACLLSISVLVITLFFNFNLYEKNSNAFNGTIIVSNFSVSLKIIIIAAVICVLSMMFNQEKYKVEGNTFFENPVLTLLCTTGMCLLVSSNSLLTLYMSLELMSLPLYILTAYRRDNITSQEAGLKYFILGALASCVYLYGASILYGFSSSINFHEISNYYLSVIERGSAFKEIPTGFLVGVILIVISVFFKMSAVPFHMWTPDVYQGSPTTTTALLASAPKAAVLGLLLRLLYGPFSGLIDQLQQITVLVAVASIFIGNFGAIMQHNFKRLLAYSAIGHIGFMLMGISSISLSGISSSIFYMIIYLVMTIAIFALLLMLKKDNVYKTEISEFAGLFRSSPVLAAAISILMFSMAGIPPFAGFFAKFYVLNSIIQQGMYVFAIAGVIATVIGSYYYLKVIKVICFDPPHVSNDENIAMNLKLIAGLGIFINLFYVLMPGPILEFAKKMAENLLGY